MHPEKKAQMAPSLSPEIAIVTMTFKPSQEKMPRNIPSDNATLFAISSYQKTTSIDVIEILEQNKDGLTAL